MEVHDSADLSVARWNRFVNRMLVRRQWHDRGILLWLLQRPHLRFLPCPYPNVANCQGWKLQAESMMASKAWPGLHLKKGLKKMNASSLSECLWLRDRFGFHLAFIEDPMVGNMLMIQGLRGQRAAIHREAMRHAQEQAQKQVRSGKEEEFIKELVGPRGGLPTLKKDLIKLATLLHQPVDPSDKVETLKEKIRGPLTTVMGTLAKRDSRSRAAKDAALMSSSLTPTPSKAAPATPMTIAPASSIGDQDARLLAMETKLQETINNQDAQFREMLNQMMIFFQKAPSLQGHPADWTFPKETQQGPVRMA